MKKTFALFIMIGLTAIPIISYASTGTGASSNQDLSTMQKTVYEKVKDSLEPEIKAELKTSKEDLRSVFDDYLILVKEIKSDLIWYLGIVITIIIGVVGGLRWMIKFYLERITENLITDRVKDNIKPILDNKITEYDKKIDEDFQKIGAEVKEKTIIILSLDSDGLAGLTIRNQGFLNTTILNSLSPGIESDTLVIDIQNLDMNTEENKSKLSVILEEVRANYANIPLLIFYKGQLSRTDFQIPELTTFANNQLSLVSNLYDCLRYQKDIGNAPVGV